MSLTVLWVRLLNLTVTALTDPAMPDTVIFDG